MQTVLSGFSQNSAFAVFMWEWVSNLCASEEETEAQSESGGDQASENQIQEEKE